MSVKMTLESGRVDTRWIPARLKEVERMLSESALLKDDELAQMHALRLKDVPAFLANLKGEAELLRQSIRG